MTLAPDLPTPIVGWRAWNVVDRGLGPELVSPVRPLRWRHRVATTATCAAGCEQCPSPECQCGLYAMVRFDALPVGFRSGAVVVGCCALWGRTVEHSAGFRGQHAYPLVLVVTSGLGLESTPRMRRLRRQLRLPTLEGALIQPQDADGVEALSRDLGRLYGVPVHPVANLPDTWSCGWARASDPEADAVRAEAVDGLAARRLGDRAARDRLTRCLQDMLDSGG